ncbi:GHKL domain-containing protein [Marinobacter sp. R17]|uniref:ATP-binding protein n=1 Tax=Marinobacter sp. R17 TaxID=2484250 RepID=UPI000F4C158A|nr:ATP-binding protein [Marinobacter sp. R17]ROU00466.1 GHKL domain-containing protein [Marinobacter sp. R17]
MRTRTNISIKATLLIWLLPLMAVFMLIAWLIHGSLLDRMTQRFVHERLQQEALFLEKQIREAYPDLDPALAASPYFKEVFHHAFAVKMGDQVSASPASLTSPLRATLEEPRTGFFNLRYDASGAKGPGEHVIYRKAFSIDGQPVVLAVAEDLGALARSQFELHLWTAFVALGLLGLLIAMVWLAVNLALRPVRHLQHSLEELQTGKRSRLDLNAPREFIPLTSQLNTLLDQSDRRLKRSRQSLANLSHSIKTPLAAIQQALEDTSTNLDANYRHRLATRLLDIDHQLESEMRRSQFAGPQVGQFALPVQQARDLLWMIGRLYPHLSFELRTELNEDFTWPVEENDLNEIMGNLVDNAGKWAKSCVDLSIIRSSESLQITVRDDGHGVPDNELETLGTRGLRLDEQKPGHGLGLAIVRDLITRYSGDITFENGRRGGLTVTIVLRAPGTGYETAGTTKPAA